MPSNESLQHSFNKETVIALGKRDSQLRKTVTTKADIMAQSATFLVSDIQGKKMTKRGADGRIKSTAPNDQQYKVELEQLHYKERKNGYNIYTQQGDQFALMKDNVVAVAERRFDEEIITTLGTATREANLVGSPVVLNSNTMLQKLTAAFGNLHTASLPFVAITPESFAAMHGISQFGNRDYVQMEQFKGIPKSKAFEFFGLNFCVMPAEFFPGDTGAKTCFAWVQEAVGHVCDKDNASFAYDYDKEDDYSYARSSLMTGSRLIQPTGAIKFYVNDSGFAVD